MDSQGIGGADCLTLPAYLPEVESSTCLLLSGTPSPTLSEPKHPLADTPKNLSYEDINDMPKIAELSLNEDAAIGDSSSSGSNSFVQDPVSAQLINNISMLDYQTLSKSGDLISGQEHIIRQNGSISHSNKKLPAFVNWNWNLIRTVFLWIVISGLVACAATVIGMIVTLPKSCNPETSWYQGKVFYEIFPASFADSNNDGIGDLKGLAGKIEYLKSLQISAIRLNYIFDSPNYPENYKNYSSIVSVDRNVGTIEDFENLVSIVHNSNMSIIIDLPVVSLIPVIKTKKNNSSVNPYLSDPMTTGLKFWAKSLNVDGFYLKGLENYVNEPEFGESLQTWKQIIGFNKIFIASYEAYKKAKGMGLNVILSRINLIDVTLNVDKPTMIKAKIQEVLDDEVIWSKPSNPWIHWNVGNVEETRLASKVPSMSLTYFLLQLMLPGTVSVFYGDELGLKKHEQDFHEHGSDLHNLVRMKWSDSERNANHDILSWISESKTEPNFSYLDVLKNLIYVRLSSPTLYLNAINREGSINVNTKVRTSEDNMIVIERWYPRRPSFVYVGNIGDKNLIKDMTSWYYGGKILASTNHSSINENLYFEKLTLKSGSAYIIKLEK